MTTKNGSYSYKNVKGIGGGEGGQVNAYTENLSFILTHNY